MLPAVETLDYRLWLPEEAAPAAVHGRRDAHRRDGPDAHGQIPAFLDLENERQPFEPLTREMKLPGTTTRLPAQRRALVDYITVDGV